MKINARPFSFILLIPLIFTLFSCRESPKEEEVVRAVKAIQVADPSLIRSRPFPGVIRAENRVNLSFRVDGPLIEFPVDVGDIVKKKEALARIDPKDFEVALRNAQANLEKAKASSAFAERDYARALRIQKADPGAISESLVDRKRQDRNRLRAEVNSLEAELEAASDQLEYTNLRAPFDGIVVATYFDNFEYVRAKQSVLRMLDISRVEMVVDIPEHIISYIPTVKQVIVRLDVIPGREFSADIKEIGTEASITTRTYPVTLVMNQPEDVQIFAGMSGEAKFIGKAKPGGIIDALTIPISSVFSDKEAQKSFVWIIDEDIHRVSRREVTVEKVSPTGLRVVEGLSPGEWIAIAGVHYLREGQLVEITDFTGVTE
ncbi:MAG: Multidrug resistance protein MdtA [Chlamydiae bacterium]|nr:Multidrug resistance protein MdtA [Chlamydiota bacterium]